MSMNTQSPEVVADPVSHISISGVHGRDELNERLANAPEYHNETGSAIRPVLLGAAIGAMVMYFLRR